MEKETREPRFSSSECGDGGIPFPLVTGRVQTRLSDSALEFLGLSPKSQHRSHSQSTCSFQDLPKRYEETLARHRIQLTRKAFPLKENKSDFKSAMETEETNSNIKQKDTERCASIVNYRQYNKPLLPSRSKYYRETPFQRFCEQSADKLHKRRNNNRDESPKPIILPNIAKISPDKTFFQIDHPKTRTAWTASPQNANGN